MFNCDECGVTSAPGVKPNKFISDIREKNYITPKHGLVGVGWEIVKELDLCQKCFDNVPDEIQSMLSN